MQSARGEDVTHFLETIKLPATALSAHEAGWLAAQAAALQEDATIVHLGVASGASLMCSRAGNPTALVVGIDHDPLCMGLDIDAELFLADSRTFAWGAPVNFLFVDTDHTEGSTIAEIQNWHGRIVPGGVIAFHDYGNAHLHWCKGVKRAVDKWDWAGWTRIDAPDSIRAFRKNGDV